MSRAVSANDRALIDAAIAAGRVRRIPRGQSSFPLPVWNGSDLVYADGQNAMRRTINAQAKGSRLGYVDPAVTARRRRVLEMHGRGLTVAEIVQAEKVSEYVIRMDHTRLGILPNNSVTAEDPRRAADARRVTVAKMRAANMSASRIAEALKVNITTIKRDFRALKRGGGSAEGVAA